jgi:hypothetical protein
MSAQLMAANGLYHRADGLEWCPCRNFISVPRTAPKPLCRRSLAIAELYRQAGPKAERQKVND